MSDNKKDFFKLYSSSVKEIWKLSRNEIRLFLSLCRTMNYSSGSVILDPALRRLMASNLNVSMKTFYNLISSLKKKGFLRANDDVYYFVNQDIASKGRD